MKIHATTAQFPGLSFALALEKIHQGVSEGIWGDLSSSHVQICPQSGGILNEQACEDLRIKYPSTQLRLHANARVHSTHMLMDFSTASSDNLFYYRLLADRMKRLGSTHMSLHAGYIRYCSHEKLWDNYQKVVDEMDRVCPGIQVSMEGLYPSPKMPQHIDSWDAYEKMFVRSIPYALDLSHLNIVAHQEKRWDFDLLKEMLASHLCHEIHVSDNFGTADSHSVVVKNPKWFSFFDGMKEDIHSNAVIFSEGNLMRSIRPSYD